jgi:hypothetical protein
VKFLALSFVASLVAVLPVSAQPSRSPQAPPNRQPQSKPAPQPQSSSGARRIDGKNCVNTLIDAEKKEVEAPCHYLSIGGSDGASMKFTFYTEREELGVGYVVGKDLKQDEKGRSYYEITGMFVQQSGKPLEVRKATGLCSLDSKLLGNNVAAACIAKLSGGMTGTSLIGK